MGWLFSESWPTASAMRDHLRDELRTSGYEIVKDALVAYGRRYYAAVKFTGTEKTAPDYPGLGKTSIFVALLAKHGGDYPGWGYKDMGESSGPNEVDCPLSVLDAASPVEELYTGSSLEWATNWRARVRAHWASKTASRATVKTLKPGDKVWLKNTRDNPFTITERPAWHPGRGAGKLYGYGASGGFYRLPKTRIERVEPASA